MKDSILNSISNFVGELIRSARAANLNPNQMPPHLGLLNDVKDNPGRLVSHKEPLLIDDIPLDLWKKFAVEYRNANDSVGFVIWGVAGDEDEDTNIVFIVVNIASDYYYMTMSMNGDNVNRIDNLPWIPCFSEIEEIRH